MGDFHEKFIGGTVNNQHSDIGDVLSYVPRYYVGGGGLARFPSRRTRLGYGFFSNLFSFFKPMLRKGAQELVSVASKVASDAIQGENVKESLKKHALSGVSNLLQNKPSEPNVSTEVSKKKLTPASARRQPKTSVKRSISGKGKKRVEPKKEKKKKSVRFPILKLMK